MRKLFLMLLMAAFATPAIEALTVENTSGGLAQLVEDTSITELTVTGTMDARDFLFITQKLTELTSLDLSQVTITEVAGSKTLYGTVTDYPANEIPRTAFFGKKLTTVSLPATVESIGFAAFAGCYQLSSVTMPEGIFEIDDYAFSGSGLTSVEVPASVSYMGRGVFSRCESLVSAVINSETIGDFAFLGDVNLSDVNVGASVTSIGKGAFSGCAALTTVNIAKMSRLSRIDDEAFINSGLENIDIMSLNIGTVGDWAFAQTRLSELALSGSISHLGEGALAHNPLLTSVTLPNILSTRRVKAAPSVVLRRTIERVYDYTFAGDSQLDARNMLLLGVKYIGNYAFYNCSQEMDTMYLPSSIVWLGNRAMAGMTGLKALNTKAEDVPELGDEVWAGVDQPSIPLITPSDEATELYKAADQWKNFFFEEDFLLGDVNGDGLINISDVTTLINYEVNGGGDIIELAADMNGDGIINITDVTNLINYVLNGTRSMSVVSIHKLAAARYMTTSDVLGIQSISLSAGQTRTIDVDMTNIEHDYIAMQLELVLPQGVTLTAVEGLDRGGKHSFYDIEHEAMDNVYTLMGVSMDMLQFTGSEGKVFRLTVTANEDFDGQNAQVELANVRLVTPDHEIYLAGNALVALNDATGIEQVNADREIAAVRYINVAGQESEAPFDGINIVVTTYTDGSTTTTKVVK